jgi:hypothetical protein
MRRLAASLLLFLLASVTPAAAFAQPQPGDVYREYIWSSPPGNRRPQRAQEVFSSVSPYRPKDLGNPPRFTNHVTIDDLDQAVKAEVTIELWSGHAGTTKRNIAINGHPPIAIPEPSLPLDRGAGGAPEDYQYRWAPTVVVPLQHLKSGINSFMFDTLAGPKPVFRVWGATFRIYYGPGKKGPQGGKVVSPAAGSRLGDRVKLAVAYGERMPVRVDYFGHYRDFNVSGDGAHQGWQFRLMHGQPLDHLGTSTTPPFAMEWDTRWVPDQDQPMKVMARLTETNGLSTLTEVVDGLTFGPRSVSVALYTAHEVAKNFKSNKGKRAANKVEIPDDVRRAKAAKLFLASWAGAFVEDIGVNGTTVAKSIVAEKHGFSVDLFDVPVRLLRRGTNEVHAFSSTTHHGIDILWPGMELKVQYPPARRLKAR